MNILLFTHIGGKFIKNSTSLEELSQYIDIFYNNARTDSSGATNERIEVKRCTSKDFGTDKQSIDLFYKYYLTSRSQYYSLCPDFKGKEVVLSKGTPNKNDLQSSFSIRF